MKKGNFYYIAGIIILLVSISSISLLENIFGEWGLWISCFGVPFGAYLGFKGRELIGLKNKNFCDKD